MRRFLLVCLCLLTGAGLAAGRAGAAAQPGTQFVGTWSGTWEGMGQTGGVELVVEQGSGGAIAVRLSVTGEPAYKTTFQKLSFDGNKMSGQYPFPLDESIVVVSETTFEGATGKGTWAARDGSGNEVAAGTWTLAKK